MKNDFAVFILTHGRAQNVRTYKTLRDQGYTGKIYLMIDDEDKQIDEYKRIYKDQVVIFNKQKAIEYTDSGDNFNKHNSVVYARNWNFVVAKELDIKYFLQLDDDYTTFRHTLDNNYQYITKQNKINDMNKLCEIFVDFLIESKAHAVCMSQGGDFIGGAESRVGKIGRKGLFARKAMNSFFMTTDRPFKFMGRINEDVNAYVALGNIGKLFITVPRIRLEQIQTQANAGGLTDIYLDLGTYVKSFYSVMYSPSCVKISEVGAKNRRLHHRINWENAVPEIIDERLKK